MTFDEFFTDGYDNLPMAHGDKPYRVYRGGRARGNVPLKHKRRPSNGRKSGSEGGPEGPKPRRRLHLKRIGWKLRILIGLLAVFLLVAVWVLASYLALQSGVQKANKRLGPAATRALTPMHGLMLTTPSNILVLGTDHSKSAGRAADNHSDSIMIVHTDPSRHRIVYLSIPRDLRVPIPGHGDDRINAALQIGGPPLAIRTVSAYTGLSVNHVIVVDFSEFRQLIDTLGGVDIYVPRPILSNAFDCPYPASRCATWRGYRFRKGLQHMNGKRALIYSRIRENRLDPSETDVTRGARQQQVVQAVLSKITGLTTMLQLPWLGDDLMRPMATDLSAGDLMQLGWIKLRASSTLHCRLGGDPETIGGANEIAPAPENFSVIGMVEGTVPLRAPNTAISVYAPGCSTKAMLP
ncbi:MAG: LCP family protein [Gaiellaceae bacterium]|jgi:LCP family protein required for cell wall assembly